METITLKDDRIFQICDTTGNIPAGGGEAGFGLYLDDTRYLSHLTLTVNGKAPELLSFVNDHSLAATFHLSAPYNVLRASSTPEQPPAWTDLAHAIGVLRQRFVKGGITERLEFTNYNAEAARLTAVVQIGVDFLDLFEIRGFPNEPGNERITIEPSQDGRVISFSYESKEAKPRALRCVTSLAPAKCEKVSVTGLNGRNIPEIQLFFELELAPQASRVLQLQILPEPKATVAESLRVVEQSLDFTAEVETLKEIYETWIGESTCFKIGDYVLNKIMETSTFDMRLLMQQQPHGLVITAGIPWYFTLFGRDSLITAMQTLSLNPQIAVDTLRGLAALQATTYDDWRDSEPGKILHEVRLGDMTVAGKTPHSPYYGSVDSTLLFIHCFAETLKWIAQPESLFKELMPNIRRALNWIYQHGDTDGDGYVEFKRRSERGILHQGWKDSDESIGGTPGPRPSQPLALIEVQGYLYAAKVTLAEALHRYGDASDRELATKLEREAADLKTKFNRDFWWAEEEFFYQALDAAKQPIRYVTSNPGHCLWSGIVDADKAPAVARRLLQPDMLSGWGVRTLSTQDATYNPMSYHNGSIWPHDNALIIAGLRNYGFEQEAQKVAGQIFAAAAGFNNGRLPELYCGFPRVKGQRSPAAYPVSCSPQAWAAGTPFLLWQTLLGLKADVHTRRVTVAPMLPDGVETVQVRGLRVGDARLNLNFELDHATGQIRHSYKEESTGASGKNGFVVSAAPGQS
jgi:glycogen debranching enzyme